MPSPLYKLGRFGLPNWAASAGKTSAQFARSGFESRLRQLFLSEKKTELSSGVVALSLRLIDHVHIAQYMYVA